MMQLNWSPITIAELEEFMFHTELTNWMQTWPYAYACHKRDHKNCQIVRIIENEKVIGIVLIEQIKLGFIHLVQINRGPLWLKGQNIENKVLQFAELLNTTFPKRWFRRRRWLPELESTEKAKHQLQKIGFQLTQHSFDTIVIDLLPSEENLRKNMQQKWRNCLSKAEKKNFSIEIQESIQNFQGFIQKYEEYKKIKNFIGPSSEFLSVEVKSGLRTKSHLLVWAIADHQPIAGMLIALHGNSASYRVGWNTKSGRDMNAHYSMLWQLIRHLKNKGFRNFDLGGILPKEEPELTHFKRGLGGREVQSIGYLK